MDYVRQEGEHGAFQQARLLLPESLRNRLPMVRAADAEEIRLRLGRPMSLVSCGQETELGSGPVSRREVMQVLEKATDASLHSAAEAMARGYITRGGIRIGLCGDAAVTDGQVTGFRSFSSLAIRIPRQCVGVCNGIVGDLFTDGPVGVLIISPPGLGKTTALRELTRIVSDRGWRTAVADERGELSAFYEGQASFDLGRCSDVLVNVPKAEAAMMLLRGMNPRLIAMDEITQRADIRAIEEVCGCGVAVLASAHAGSPEDLRRRPLYRELMELGVFDWLVCISMERGTRRYTLQRLSA